MGAHNEAAAVTAPVDATDGHQGSGSSITMTYDMTYDPQAKPFLSTIHLSGQNGTRPVFKDEPVAPLW
jgi:hypothetical protein